MGNRPCLWSPEEIAALTLCAQQGKTDVETAEAVALAYTAAQRRTPQACRTKACSLGLAVVWTTRPAMLTPGYREKFGYEDENQAIKATREDEKFIEAMQRAGYAPRDLTQCPGTHSPVRVQPAGTGSCSSSAGWIV